MGADRPDPVTGAKVVAGSTWRGQRVTGIAVEHDPRVTGDAPGACAAITGTPYRGPGTSEAWCDPVLPREPAGFSVRSPQHALAPRESAAPARGITGSFALGQDKLTGNLEFLFWPRADREEAAPQARLRITGEGRTGNHVTGGAWSEHARVTGTEGATAGQRNPSERAGKPQAFAGARRFAALANHEEPKHLVTGMSGYSSDTSAKVTLSGGAQG